MRRVSMATRDELLAAVSERYGASNRAEKKTIIDERAGSTFDDAASEHFA